MDVLVVRHAHAGERDPRRWPDDDKRPLSKEGTQKFREVARELGRLVGGVAAIRSSALVRAWQTAEILCDEAGWPKPARMRGLEPGGGTPSSIVQSLGREPDEGCVVLVGHEPDLGELIAYFIVGDAGKPVVDLKKGAAALLRFDGAPAAGTAVLRWLLPPRVFVGD